MDQRWDNVKINFDYFEIKKNERYRKLEQKK